MPQKTAFIWLRIILAVIAGGIAPLALAPFDFWYLAPVSAALLFALLHESSVRGAALIGWCYGLGLYGVGVSWVFVSIHEHGNAPVWLAGLLTFVFVAGMALFMLVQTWLYRRYFYRGIGFIAIWVSFEWLRSWLFTGFPWLYMGYALTDTPLSIFAPFGGVWLLSLYTVALGVATIGIIRCYRRPLPALALIVLFTAPWLLLDKVPQNWTTQTGTTKVYLVQASIPQQLKWQRSQLPEILQRYVDLSQTDEEIDMVIWPETAVPTFYPDAVRMLAPYIEQLESQQRTLVSGMPSVFNNPLRENNLAYYNSITLLANGEGSYHKQRLVPFGEYVPLEKWLRGTIDFFNLPMSQFSLGPAEQSLLQVKDAAMAPFICYEIAYPELVRNYAVRSNVMLTVSNDAWFGDSIAPQQHLQIARMRALENGRWLIRATNNGLTAVMRPDGKIDAELPQFETDALYAEVPLMQGTTPYQQYGDKPLQFFIGILLLLSILFSFRHKNR
ncbi:apolipoprotein N-acyltransferase [Aliamphritea ceti]|uniref:apolipoprotein N-acyltransferase n=1 Tax=Aliamphritea ceti TaxID=1524258 RepID=UPI0021C29D4C|nr:apolipoprotein N-acyltransferase [Aliamphritea ceti]